MQVVLVIALVFAFIVAVFAVQNAGPIEVNFLVWNLRTSVAVVVLGAAAFGALSGGLLGIGRNLRLRMRLRQAQLQVQRLQKEPADSELPAPEADAEAPSPPPTESRDEESR